MKFEKQWNAVKGFCKKIGKKNALIVLSALLIAAAIYINASILLKNDNEGYGGYNEPGGDSAGAGNTNTDYFATSVVSRERTRDEAMEVLQSVIDDENADEATKTQARVDLSALAKAMENESKIETLVISKGFEQCVAVISGDRINVIVKSEGLNAAEVAQINEIVYSQTGITPANTVIVEKMS